MKKFMCTILSVAMCAVLISGCGTSLEGEESVVYVDKKGTVLSLDAEELDQDFYDETELKEFVDNAVQEYTDAYGKDTVKTEELTVENGIAKLKMKYKTPEDYTNFNGIELYEGKVVASLAAGYVYDGNFARVEDGKVVGAATKQEIYAQEDLKVVIIRANTNVKVDGQICFVSCENVKLTGTDSVSIRDGYYLDTGADAVSENLTQGTEQLDAVVENTETSVDEDVSGNGSFETDVYTFIVYK